MVNDNTVVSLLLRILNIFTRKDNTYLHMFLIIGRDTLKRAYPDPKE